MDYIQADCIIGTGFMDEFFNINNINDEMENAFNDLIKEGLMVSLYDPLKRELLFFPIDSQMVVYSNEQN